MKSKNLTLELLTPSWLSGLVAVLAGLVVSVGIIAAFHLATSGFQQQLQALQQTQPALTQPGELPPSQNNSLQANLPVLALFAAVGLAVYFIASSIVGALQNVAELEEEMDYVNARPKQMIKDFWEAAGFRLGVLAVWLLFSVVFFKRIVPYAIRDAHISATNVVSITGIKDALIAFLLIAASMQLHTLFLRLTARKPRLFSN